MELRDLEVCTCNVLQSQLFHMLRFLNM